MNIKQKETLTLAESLRTGWACVKLAFRYKPYTYSLMIAIEIVQAVIGYVEIFALGFILDELVSVIAGATTTYTYLYTYILVYSGALVLPSIIGYLHNYLATRFFREFSDALIVKFIEHTATRDIQIIESSEYQNRRAKAREQGVWRVYGTAENVSLMFARVISIFLAIGYLGTLDWRFAVLGVLASVPVFLVEYFHGQRVYGVWDEDTYERRQLDENKNLLHNKISLIEIRLFQNIKYFLNRIVGYMESFQSKMQKTDKQRLGDEFIGSFIYISAFAGAIYLITEKIVARIMSVGQFTVALGAFSKLQGDLGRMFNLIGKFSKDVRYSHELVKVMEIENVLVVPTNPAYVDYSSGIEIEFRNVWFKYPGGDNYVFKNLNLTIGRGQKVALVGHNGAGKTTFVHLLLRVYDPDEGAIYINGIDIKDIDLDTFYHNAAVLMQEFANFKLKAKEIIALGDTNNPYDEKRMLQAARASHAYSFIENWTDSYDSQVGREFDGKELSGGERQRMAIARVMYRDAQMIILDEPTSAVDAIAEQEIFESLYKNSAHKTLLTISHRFSTVRQSDIIVVLEHGEVQEQGSHSELISKQGRYHQLYTAQASAYHD